MSFSTWVVNGMKSEVLTLGKRWYHVGFRRTFWKMLFELWKRIWNQYQSCKWLNLTLSCSWWWCSTDKPIQSFKFTFLQPPLARGSEINNWLFTTEPYVPAVIHPLMSMFMRVKTNATLKQKTRLAFCGSHFDAGWFFDRYPLVAPFISVV